MKRLTPLLVVLLFTATSCSTPEEVSSVPVTGDISTDVEQRKKQVEVLSASESVSLSKVIETEEQKIFEYVKAVELAEFYAAIEEAERLEQARIEAAQKEERKAAERQAQTQQPPPNNSPPEPISEKSSGGNCGGWDSLILAHFGSLQPACRVMMCESGGDPNALNGPPYNAAGLFQIIDNWAEEFTAYTGVNYYDGRFNPNANAKFAAYLVRDSGWASQFDCY